MLIDRPFIILCLLTKLISIREICFHSLSTHIKTIKEHNNNTDIGNTQFVKGSDGRGHEAFTGTSVFTDQRSVSASG